MTYIDPGRVLSQPYGNGSLIPAGPLTQDLASFAGSQTTQSRHPTKGNGFTNGYGTASKLSQPFTQSGMGMGMPSSQTGSYVSGIGATSSQVSANQYDRITGWGGLSQSAYNDDYLDYKVCCV
jgi:hypothetical protein